MDKKNIDLKNELNKAKTINYLIGEIIKIAANRESLDLSMEKLSDMLIDILDLSSLSIKFSEFANQKTYCRTLKDNNIVWACPHLPDEIKKGDLSTQVVGDEATLYITLKDHVSNKEIGYIFATSKDKDFFDTPLLSFFEILAVQIPVIVSNSLLFEKMQEESTRDMLTNSFNRKQLDMILRNLKEEQAPLSLAFFDLDNFKFVNDTFGHSYGDRILLDISDIALDLCRKHKGELFRYGGDEFVLLLYNCPLDQALEILDELRVKVMNNLDSNQELDIKQTISIGLANYPETVDQPEDLLKAADSALISGKLKQKNKIYTNYKNDY